MQRRRRRLTDLLSACGRGDGSFSYAPAPEKGKSWSLRRSEFWRHECKCRVVDGAKRIRTAHRPGDWRLLAERASQEMDSEKLMNLVLELNTALEEWQSRYYLSD